MATEMSAMYMKNNPDKAKGCLKNVETPSFSQTRPVRAGTMLSFMSECHGLGHALAQHPFEVGGVVRLEHGRFARQVVVPQA